MKFILIILTFILSFSGTASVWDAQRNWNENDLISFSEWIRSESYNPLIFSSPTGAYFGTKTDCADAIIAAKVIYAFENGLNFKLKTSSYNSDIITNKTPLFDFLDNPHERVIAFIHYLGESIGTEALARFNSYPVDPREIRPSDFYVSRWKTNGEFVRHAYMIKDVLPTGHLKLYSSTTPVKVRELEVREGMPLHILSGRPWGFKRFLPLEISFETPIDSSDKQYEMLEQYGDDHFFSRVVDELKTEEDTLDSNLKRRVKNLCSQLKLRKREIDFTQTYLEENSYRCMSYDEYNEHSTPSRDQSLQNGIKRLLYGWKKIRTSSYTQSISSEVVLALDYLLRKNTSLQAYESLNNLCSINLTLNGTTGQFNLKHFFDLKLKSKLSYHPNDSYEMRWGLEGKKTHCSSF
ncbi:hypothetical protein [Halobacteriovorax sp. HLS]|uniref:hypothetical protein n=1 Tax=Halobacteriovorax sp. HLS TaxID=2234000 RepID=UPI000FDB082E|nr:hypothetical protein [Halobacteriovorax sp. HLS]